MWFILKQLDITVPSLASVKALKLPNMEPPKRVKIYTEINIQNLLAFISSSMLLSKEYLFTQFH